MAVLEGAGTTEGINVGSDAWLAVGADVMCVGEDVGAVLDSLNDAL